MALIPVAVEQIRTVIGCISIFLRPIIAELGGERRSVRELSEMPNKTNVARDVDC
jgi:hypothetical protein